MALVARVTGFLEKRLFTEGAEVKPGDLLYQIEKPPFEADVEAKTAAVAQYNALLQNASITLGRATTLLSTPAGQRSTVDDATASQRSNAALLLAAQAQLKTSQINSRLHRHHRADQRQDQPDGHHHRQRGRPNTGTIGDDRQPDPMYVIFPVAVHTAIELRDRYAARAAARRRW